MRSSAQPLAIPPRSTDAPSRASDTPEASTRIWLGADPRPRPRELSRARRHARLSGARPERDQRPHRHVERAPRVSREYADRRLEDLRQLGIDGDADRARPPGSTARARCSDRRASSPRPASRASAKSSAERLARERRLPRVQRDLEDGAHRGAAVGELDERGRRRARRMRAPTARRAARPSRTLGGVVVVALRAREHRPQREDDERREAPLEQQEARDLGPGEAPDGRSAPASPRPRRAAPRRRAA